MMTELPSRFEIRKLGPEHSDWAKAIMCHTNLFYGPVWTSLYKGRQTASCLALYKTASYLVDHQINSGYSFGVFDKDYVFKRPESAATGGKLYWDLDNNDATAEEMLEQMDFPLVSIALSYDSFNPLDLTPMTKMVEVLPEYGLGFHLLDVNDKRDPASWRATGPLQVLFRNSTSTRHDYEGMKLMKHQAHFLMRWAHQKGFRGIQIEAFNDAVDKVWNNPPAPFKGETASTVKTGEYEEVGEDGQKRNPFHPATQWITKVYVTLK